VLAGTGVPEPARAARNRRWLARVGWLPVGLMRGALRLIVEVVLRRVRTDKELLRRNLRAQIGRLGRDDFASLYRIAIDFDESCRFTAADLAAWPGQVLILAGAGDRVAGERTRAALKALYPQARVHTFAGAGHAAALVHPEEWRRVVLEFLA
jgi:pimeloyl-ACP methyl ester carboxylesterase